MFGRFFGHKDKKPALCPVLAPAVSDAILGTLGAGSIATMPAAAQKAFQLSIDPDATARDFRDVIESDEGLSARVLKIANSVYFDRGQPSQTIEESVVVIGLNELRCLLNATTISELFPSRNPARPQLWINDMACAIIARKLAGRLLPSRQDMAFLGGLMHDIGKLLLLQRSPEQYAEVLKKVEGSGCSFSEAEGQVYTFDHTEVGQLIAERWHFSPELTASIRNHHRPFGELAGEGGSPGLCAIIKSADTISHALGLGHQRGFTRLRNKSLEALEGVWEHIQVGSAERKDFLAQCERDFSMEQDLYASRNAS